MHTLPRALIVAACLLPSGCGDDTGDVAGTGTSSASSGGGSPAVGVSSSGAGAGGQGGDGATSTGTGGDGDGGGRSFVFDPITLPVELDQVTAMHFLPDAPDELLVLEKDGAVHHLRLVADAAERLGGFTLTVHDDRDCGLISLAFSPDFAVDRALYVGFCESGTASRVDRLSFDAADLAGVPATAETIITLDEPDATQPWHNVGSIGFEPDGTLWLLSGEKTVRANAQDLSNDLGKLLRIVPAPDGPGHTPAPDNPYVGLEDHSPNVWAYGLRSPWRGTRDSRGRFWFGDVGLDTFEEVNVVLEAGSNFGWPDHEGPCDPALDDGCVDPVTHYGRSSSDPYLQDDPDHLPAGTRSVWVGPLIEAVDDDPYGGALDDHLLFGDLHTGFVRLLHVGEGREVLADVPLAHLNHGHAWDRGPGGHLHVMTFGRLLSSDTRTAELLRMRLE